MNDALILELCGLIATLIAIATPISKQTQMAFAVLNISGYLKIA